MEWAGGWGEGFKYPGLGVGVGRRTAPLSQPLASVSLDMVCAGEGGVVNSPGIQDCNEAQDGKDYGYAWGLPMGRKMEPG